MGDGITSVEECPDLYQFQKPQQANVVGPVATTLGTIGLLANTWTTSSFFSARCYAHTAYAVMRCPSVCPSVTFVLSVKMIKRIFSLFGSQTILAFPYQAAWQYSDGIPPRNGGIECRWSRQGINRHSEPISGSIACC